MRILLQPASSKEPLKHFNNTIKNGVPIQTLDGKIPEAVFSKIKNLKHRLFKYGVLLQPFPVNLQENGYICMRTLLFSSTRIKGFIILLKS